MKWSCIACLLYDVSWQSLTLVRSAPVYDIEGLRGQLQTVMASGLIVLMFAVAM